MNKHEYLEWVASRGPVGTWTHAKCQAADELIKNEAMRGCRLYLHKIGDAAVRNYVTMMVRSTYGSAETDQFLMEIKAYPEWLAS